MTRNLRDSVTVVFVLAFVMVCSAAGYAEAIVAVPDGYATQNGGTTGGGSATPVTVSTAAAFRTATGDTTPRVIIVQGRIDLGGSANIRSNKTIIGADTSSGLYNGTVQVQGSNYIFQNLTFGPSSGDVMEVSGGTNVFITKCEFYGSTDELCSIVRQADYVTVSWCKFYFPSPDDHSFASLIGNSDTATSDRGKLHVTMHHNWYAEGVRGRMPRVRFGHVHIYNNFYNSVGNGYCIGIGYECHIRLENTHFENVNGPWSDYGGTSNGEIGWAGLKFVGCSQPTFMPNVYSTIFTPPYPFTLDNVNDVKGLVTDPVYGAGNRLTLNIVDETPPSPDPLTWATAPYGVNETSITMVATTATDDSGVEYFFDCTSGGGHDSAWQDSASYTDTGLTIGITYSYQVKARDKSVNKNETGWSGIASAAPIADTTAPMPNPMTWASAPAATGIDTIAMTATTASDASGVEYFFACTAGGGYDSGWQDSPSYTDTGLTNNTTYTYRVIARDKSAGQNETGWSAEASATTVRYECTAPVENDFNGDCKVDFADYAAFASDWGAESGVVVNLITNGDFATSLSGWTTSIANPTQVQITWDAGTAKLARTVSDATAPNGNYLYQIIPVVNGNQYVLNAEWKGDLTGTDRQWAEVYVGFVASGTSTSKGSIMYKKATYGGPNATPMPWDWESILLSPNTSPVPPDGGIFTATDSYMVVAFNLGGRANAGTCYYSVDSVSVVENGPACPAMDLSGDCALDWLDVRVFAESWLNCNRNPAEECSW